MLAMRSLSGKDRLQADSDPTVRRAFAHAVTDLEGLVYFQGRKLRPGPLLNALAIWWAGLASEEQRRVAEEALRKLEAILDDEASSQDGRRVAQSGPALPEQRLPRRKRG